MDDEDDPSLLAPAKQATQESQYSQCSAYTEDSQFDEYSQEFDDADEDMGRSDEPKDQVLNGLDLAREQEAQIGQMAALLEVGKLNASILLRKLKWNAERLLENYYEDPDAMLAASGISEAVKRQRSAESGASELVTCGVCFDEVPHTDASASRCGHQFCNECWQGHLTCQIGDGNAHAIRCMAAPACPVLVEPAMVQALVDAQTFAKFARFAQKQFVDDNPYLKWCPAPDCANAIKVSDLSRTEVQCSCGMLFCFRCSREQHFPLTCQQLTEWEDKNASDSGTGQWMQVNTKRCKKCNAMIEKNGGCNWISCRCGHAFCFFCFCTDHGHHGQPCNKPPSKDESKAQSELEY